MRVGKIKRTEKEKQRYRSDAYVRFHTKAILAGASENIHILKITKILKMA